ncbi:MAG: DUF4153 domain-containing protein [Pyrinomonadaceae bacterium]
MKERTKTGLEILQAAALIGVLGDLLLRETPWGLNAFLFVTLFVSALVLLMRRHKQERLTKTNLAMGGAMVFFASMFLIRDSEQLLVFDTLAILVIMGVLTLSSFDVKASISGVFHYAAGFVWSGLTSAFGSFVLLGSDIDWKEMPGNKLSRTLFSVLRGLAIALPLIFVFGALFMAADAAYEGLVNRTLNFDIDQIVSHVLITSILAWLTAGYFRGALAKPFSTASAAGVSSPTTRAETRPVGSVPSEFEASAVSNEEAAGQASSDTSSFVAKVAAEPGEEPTSLPNNATILEHINLSDDGTQKPLSEAVGTEPAIKRDFQNLDNSKFPSVFTLGTVETVIVLGLVDLLFVSFVAVQIPYFFGGMDLVQNTPDFKLADYARRGFGELVAVSALVLPILLLSHWLLRRDGSRVDGVFKILAGIQIALLFVIMASAVQRLVLLTGELGYGLTTVRFYPMVLMTWLAVVFLWFAFTILRGARQHFAWGALWSAIVILGATNLMNPDAFIAQTNLRLMQQGRDFDASYNASLSDDALPTLVNSFDRLKADDAVTAFRLLLHRVCRKRDEGGLRSWNLSRQEASKILYSTGVRPEGCYWEKKLD